MYTGVIVIKALVCKNGNYVVYLSWIRNVVKKFSSLDKGFSLLKVRYHSCSGFHYYESNNPSTKSH